MTKVIITAEQAKAIEQHRDMGKSFLIGHILGLKYETYDEHSCTTPELSDLSKMDINTFLDALYIGYEIEKPKFEDGDSVTSIVEETFVDGTKVQKVTNVSFDKHHGSKLNLANGYWVYASEVRHATKEETFWAEFGRNYREFLHGDVIMLEGQLGFKIFHEPQVSAALGQWEKGNVTGFYLAESFKTFPTGNE